jgi:hypothetical protein
LAKDFCKIDNNIVKSIIQGIKVIIEKLDNELKCFYLKVST